MQPPDAARETQISAAAQPQIHPLSELNPMKWTRLHDERLEATSIVLFGAFILVCVLMGA